MYEDEYFLESLVRCGLRYRLRKDKVVVGFMNIRDSGEVYYSKDNFCWTQTPIEYAQRDRSADTFDADGQMIFEHDILQLRKTLDIDYTKRGWVIWHDNYGQLVVKVFEEDTIMLLGIPEPQVLIRNEFKVISRLYPS